MSGVGGLWFVTAIHATAPPSAASFDTIDMVLNWLSTLADDHLTEIHAVQQSPHGDE